MSEQFFSNVSKIKYEGEIENENAKWLEKKRIWLVSKKECWLFWGIIFSSSSALKGGQAF